MNPLASSYVAADTFFHRLHPGVKFVLIVLYAVAIFSCRTPWQVLAFLAVIALVTLLLKLPLTMRISLGLAAAALAAVWYLQPAAGWLPQIVLAVGQVVALNCLIALFNMTTRPRDIVALLSASDVLRRNLGPTLFVVSAMITVTPTIERDIQRAIDTETLRRGAAPRFYSLAAWSAILVVLLSRVLRRAEALATAMVDRGYSPDAPQTMTNHWQNRWQDVAVALLLAAPAAAIVWGLRA